MVSSWKCTVESDDPGFSFPPFVNTSDPGRKEIPPGRVNNCPGLPRTEGFPGYGTFSANMGIVPGKPE